MKGGKGSLTEAGTRVPFIAWWPDTVTPAVREEFFSLADVLPTICSIADIKIDREVDGIDLSHYFLNKEGKDREYVYMTWKNEHFVRDKNLMLKASGVKSKGKPSFKETLFDIPIATDKQRYSEKESTSPEHESRRQALKLLLDKYMAIPDDYEQSRGAELREPTEEEKARMEENKQKKKEKRDKKNSKDNE